MSEPRTEAGKRLLDGGQPAGWSFREWQEMRDAILAIEAEALVNDETADTASPVEVVEPWSHPYEAHGDGLCIHCGFVGSYAHTEEFYRKWVWPASRPAPAPSEDVVTAIFDEHTVPPHMLPEEIIGPDRKDGDGLLAALWWALDMIEQYDQHLIDHGDDPAQVRSAVHQRGLAKAHAALDAARLTLAGTRESDPEPSIVECGQKHAPHWHLFDHGSVPVRTFDTEAEARAALTRNSGEEPR